MPSFYKNLIVISDKEISMPEYKPLKNYNCYIICNNFYFDKKALNASLKITLLKEISLYFSLVIKTLLQIRV